MNYSNMTTEKLESLKSSLEEKLDSYVGMSFASPRSEYVTYEIDSIDSDEIVINANHYFDGLLRDYTVTISDDVDDDVEYNRYVDDGDLVDGGYMSFDRLPKIIRNAVLEIYTLYKELETINSILDTRAEEEEEEEDTGVHYIADVLGFSGFDYDDAKAKLENDSGLRDLLKNDNNILNTRVEEETEEYKKLESLKTSIEEKFEEIESLYSSIEEKFEELKNSFGILKARAEESKEEEEVMTKAFDNITVKRVIPQIYEISYRGHHITDLIKTDYGDWRFIGYFMKENDRAIYSVLTTVFDMRFKTKKQATIELERTFARFEVAKDELGN